MKFLFALKIVSTSFGEGMSKKELTTVRAAGVVSMLMYTSMGNSDHWD